MRSLGSSSPPADVQPPARRPHATGVRLLPGKCVSPSRHIQRQEVLRDVVAALYAATTNRSAETVMAAAIRSVRPPQHHYA